MVNVRYFEPTSLKEASDILNHAGNNACILAGGTDLIVKMKRKQFKISTVVNIKRIEGLSDVKIIGDNLVIGALTTLSETMGNALIKKHFPCLVRASELMASWQVRNIATVAGNICNASPAADLSPPLLCMDATIVTANLHGGRKIPVKDFFKSPGKTTLKQGEIVTEIRIPLSFSKFQINFKKFGVREALDIAIASVCVSALKNGKGKLSDVHIALGSVSPTPMRAFRAEKIAEKTPLSIEEIEEVAYTASIECSPIDDVRASAWYRREIVSVLTKRCLEEICK